MIIVIHAVYRHLKLTFFSDDYIVLKLRYLRSMKTNVDKNYINSFFLFTDEDLLMTPGMKCYWISCTPFIFITFLCPLPTTFISTCEHKEEPQTPQDEGGGRNSQERLGRLRERPERRKWRPLIHYC